jgi:hypothetical protein
LTLRANHRNLAAQMTSSRLLPCTLLVLAIGTFGCKRDLGECNLTGETADGAPIDGPAAFDIAYRVTDGMPMSCTRGHGCQ